MQEFKTSRLHLRTYEVSDFKMWQAGYLGRKPHPEEGPPPASRLTKLKFKGIVSFFKRMRKLDQLYVFGIFDRKTGRHLGFVDIYIIARLDFQIGNIGYNIHNQYWNNGYAKEAVQASVKFAFNKLKLHRLEAGVSPFNKASIAVAKSAEMKNEGVRKKVIFENGEWKDLHYYFVIAEQFGIKKMKPFYGLSLRNPKRLKKI